MANDLVPITQADAAVAWPRIERKLMAVPFAGCWLWTGAVGNAGYGHCRDAHQRTRSVHRLSYAAHKGDIPKGAYVLHSCDVRLCANPAHLSLGTQSANIRDAVAKGKHFSAPRLRTACPRGHSYSGLNSQGRRICAICMRETRRKFYGK